MKDLSFNEKNLFMRIECVRRARNLNQQAVAYRTCGRNVQANKLVQQRKQYMAAARLFT